VPGRIVAAYVTSMAVIGTSLLVLPEWGGAGWPLIGAIGAVGLVVGVRRHRPARPLPWYLLAATIVFGALGDALYALDRQREGIFLTLSDISYTLMVPLVTIGVLGLTRVSVVLRDRSKLVGTLMATCAAGLLVYVLVASPMLRYGKLSPADKYAIAGFLLGDLLLLAVTGRMLLAMPRNWSVILLNVGSVASIAGDIAYAVATLDGRGWQDGPANIGYLVLYAAWGAAALHPSMVDLTTPVPARTPTVSRRWMALIAVSLAVPPLTLLGESLTGGVNDGMMIAIVSVAIYVLVFTLLTDVVGAHRQATLRERGLRQAGGALVAATAQAEVFAAVRVAVGRIMPPDAQHRVFLAGEPVRGAITRIVPVADLPAEARAELAGFTAALECPILPRPRGAAEPGTVGGAVTIAADQRVLLAARDAVEVLAAEARLALERIELTEAINRLDSDNYLRTVIQNTNDVVLVIDEDDTIRYASPALGRDLGLPLPPSGQLRDLVTEDELAGIEATISQARDTIGPDGVRDTWHLRRANGSRVVVEVSCRDLRDDRMVRGYVLTLRDVTAERKRHEDEIRQALRARPAGQNRHNSSNKFR
jgi:PAS domain S-box-containing protein